MPIVYVEDQPKDKSFAVYVGGDDDHEGKYDCLFSYGKVDGWLVIHKDTARAGALAMANRISKKIGGGVVEL